MMPWHIQSALSLFRKTGNGAVPVQKIAFKKRTVPQSQIACRNGEKA